ncbi:MAG: tRNA (adenosine(37)-N6)-threonylcarbamoyltransferase complex ATPase subunit type 1 TsaE [Candidatus Omnitrophota bacterium]|nr:tRNA (adenosine(37)-N6)-threonylcarbamoyltransferase complex ATPase subunit type 1 TsaE [Candidatus Omnitrophota bacterium]MDZ4241824.1 tRNA (adenosine(37)-N6)-threonylcarbamoyltransferase complex ATPase subunit type 1 TsaE [Candidatus Omnitrophota bacterium]
MDVQNIHSRSEKETRDLGRSLASFLKKGDIVCLFGDLGSGKTTFVKGLAEGFKIKPSGVNSPTFVLMNVYEGKLPVYHFDLYRIEGQDLPRIGYEEFFYGDGISVVEWADRLGNEMPAEYLSVRLAHQSPDERMIEITAHGEQMSRRWEAARL